MPCSPGRWTLRPAHDPPPPPVSTLDTTPGLVPRGQEPRHRPGFSDARAPRSGGPVIAGASPIRRRRGSSRVAMTGDPPYVDAPQGPSSGWPHRSAHWNGSGALAVGAMAVVTSGPRAPRDGRNGRTGVTRATTSPSRASSGPPNSETHFRWEAWHASRRRPPRGVAAGGVGDRRGRDGSRGGAFGGVRAARWAPAEVVRLRARRRRPAASHTDARGFSHAPASCRHRAGSRHQSFDHSLGRRPCRPRFSGDVNGFDARSVRGRVLAVMRTSVARPHGRLASLAVRGTHLLRIPEPRVPQDRVPLTAERSAVVRVRRRQDPDRAVCRQRQY